MPRPLPASFGWAPIPSPLHPTPLFSQEDVSHLFQPSLVLRFTLRLTDRLVSLPPTLPPYLRPLRARTSRLGFLQTLPLFSSPR